METFYPTDSGRNVLVLVIEDENVSRKALGRLLARQGYTTETVGTAEEAVAVLAIGRLPSVALVDLDLPGMSGAELLAYLVQKAPPIRTVLVTAASEERVARIVDGMPVGYLRKPINLKDLLRMIDEPKVIN
jgi:CheY-like chemotaxis protein